jgi:hypothetical protein
MATDGERSCRWLIDAPTSHLLEITGAVSTIGLREMLDGAEQNLELLGTGQQAREIANSVVDQLRQRLASRSRMRT